MKMKNQLIIYVASAVVLCIVVFIMYSYKGEKEAIKPDRTEEILSSIRAMKTWEFLAVTREETIKREYNDLWGIGSKKQMRHVYTGRLKFGIDIDELPANCLKCHGDTAEITLPKIKLLSKDFIISDREEFNNGNFDDESFKIWRQKAAKKMLANCDNAETHRQARQNGEIAVRDFIRKFGYTTVKVSYNG